MGDFLSNLVTRSTAVSTNLHPQLRPRPVSIYESSWSGPDSPVEDQAVNAAAVNPRPVPAPAPQGEPSKERHTSTVSASDESLAWLETWRKHHLSQAEANPILPAQPVQGRQAMVEAARGPSLSPGDAREDHPVEAQANRVAREMGVMPPPLQSPTLAPSQLVTAAVRTHETPGSLHEPPMGVGNIDLKPTQIVVEPAAIRPMPLVSLPKPAETSGREQPIIHVSIGRIEVRLNATPGQAHTSSARPSAAVMSLEDYLRMRNGGRR